MTDMLFDEYGRPYIVVRDASGLDLAAADAISVLARRGLWMPAFNCECVETWNNGSGSGWAFLNGRAAASGPAAESSHISSGSILGGRGLSLEQYNWDKTAVMHFFVTRKGDDPQAVCRTQFKADAYPPAAAELADAGIGLEVRNYSLYGESYGLTRAEVDLETELCDDSSSEILIVHMPGEKIEWYIDGVLKGMQTASGVLPCGVCTMNICNSVKNGAGGGVNVRYYFSGFTLWRAP